MTDKVNVEIPSETDGILKEQLAKEGDVVPVGARIAVIDDGSLSSATKADEVIQKKEKPAERQQQPTAPEPVATPATSQAPSPQVKGTAAAGQGKLSPKVRMMLREYSLDPGGIVPTGKDGLVTVDDVLRTVERRSTGAGFTQGPIPLPPTPSIAGLQPGSSAPERPVEPMVRVQIPVFQLLRDGQRETRTPLAGVRKLISDHMIKSIQTSAHVTTFEDIDFTELVLFREGIKRSFRETYGANLTYMPFIIKAACAGMREFPKINASMTDKEIIFKNYYNIGIAVAREDGLIVPVIKDADKKSIVELAVEISQLGEKAKNNRLLPEDVSGGTFTVTNAGMFGATSSTPIINQPQVAILGVHAIVKRPWVVNNEIVIRDISSFGLSFDHRLIDGHTAVQFLHRVHEYLAHPTQLLLQLR
jgi:pyruvate/2-oxoglutarate dehydrogenase complex dihydrolipoamide acyltransferase (E2) component